jgi:anthranilate phosphoribosyltransferase
VAALGHLTAKHGSYSNTSAVGSTDAIERLGMIVDIPSIDAQEALAVGGFHFTDAHAWKTIHDLSHAQPRRETVNHVVGPMTPPIHPSETCLTKIVGVSEKLHPSIIAKALALLASEHGIFNLRHGAAVCGLDRVLSDGEVGIDQRVRDATVLDELSPFASVVSIVRQGQYAGTHQLTPRMFGVTFHDPRSVFVKNDVDSIMAANRRALRGEDTGDQLPEYLAMGAAFSLYMAECLDHDPVSKNRPPSEDALRLCFFRCLSALREGRVAEFLDQRVAHSRELVG